MKHDVTVPQVGESITSGILASWSKQTGDYITEGEELFELETDKATLPVPATVSGVVTCLVEVDTEVEIGRVVARIDTEGALPAGGAPPAGGALGVDERTLPEPSLSPAVRRLVEEHGVDPAGIAGTGKGGRILKEDVTAHLARLADEATIRPAGSPGGAAPGAEAALPAAREAPGSVSGAPTGAEAALPAAREAPGSVSGAPTSAEAALAGAVSRKPMSRLRRRIAANLVKSRQESAHLTTFTEVDMSAVIDLRARYKDAFEKRHGTRLGFMSFFLKAAAEALRRYPEVNAYIDGNDIVYHEHIHIGVALSAEAGLIVPVVRNVQDKGFGRIEAEIADFIVRAGKRAILPDEFAGGTFTISNGGVFGSMLSTPIPNPPQTGVLGMHAIQKRAVVVDDQIVIRPMMYLALTYDHRLIDGREAIGFLKTIRDAVEEPSRLLIGV